MHARDYLFIFVCFLRTDRVDFATTDRSHARKCFLGTQSNISASRRRLRAAVFTALAFIRTPARSSRRNKMQSSRGNTRVAHSPHSLVIPSSPLPRCQNVPSHSQRTITDYSFVRPSVRFLRKRHGENVSTARSPRPSSSGKHPPKWSGRIDFDFRFDSRAHRTASRGGGHSVNWKPYTTHTVEDVELCSSDVESLENGEKSTKEKRAKCN